MGAKVIQVSTDGSTWYTLPGGTGRLSRNGAEIDDTVFGQTWQSSEAGIKGAEIVSDAIFKGYAGYAATIKKAGSSTPTTGEPCSLVSGQRYKVTDPAKNLWDRTATVVIYDDVADVTNEIESFDFLFGQFTFKSTYTVLGTITADFSYFATVGLGKPRSYTLGQTADYIDTTDFNIASSNGGWTTGNPGLRSVSFDFDGVYDATETLYNELASGAEVIAEISPDGGGLSVARGYFKVTVDDQGGDVGALEEETTTLSLAVPNPDDLVEFPFSWQFDPATDAPQAVQTIINAYMSEAKVYVRYLPDGVAGYQFDSCVVTDTSLSADMTDMNRLAVTFTADGAPTVV